MMIELQRRAESGEDCRAAGTLDRRGTPQAPGAAGASTPTPTPGMKGAWERS